MAIINDQELKKDSKLALINAFNISELDAETLLTTDIMLNIIDQMYRMQETMIENLANEYLKTKKV